jgi:hypothetical protein
MKKRGTIVETSILESFEGCTVTLNAGSRLCLVQRTDSWNLCMIEFTGWDLNQFPSLARTGMIEYAKKALEGNQDTR